MQGDLISRSALIEALRQNCGIWKDTTEKFIKVIEEQPTAYSVDKVVAEIKKSPTDDCGLVVRDGTEPMIWKSKAIEIVRNGGKE